MASNPYGSPGQEMQYLQQRRAQRVEAGPPYDADAELAAIDARIVELQAQMEGQ